MRWLGLHDAHTVVMQSGSAPVMAILSEQIWYNGDGRSGGALASYVEAFFSPPGVSGDGLHCAHF